MVVYGKMKILQVIYQIGQKIDGVPGNLAVSIIIQDPNNTNIMYLGTGEKYTLEMQLEMVYINQQMEVVIGV